MIQYKLPQNWIYYDISAVVNGLIEAKAAVLSLTTIPYQRSWVDALQHIQLKREVAGTSKIEGADFTENELEAALKETLEQLLTRSQRQAHAAVKAYRWIAQLPDDKPINCDLICDVHRLIVTDADDDHCPPGEIRIRDQNVTFGTPIHRGVEGGEDCKNAFLKLCESVQKEFLEHDLLIQALALHYHFAAMHPFLDGNGRTARALEALMLQRAGLRDTMFIAMSNYYYDEKISYLKTLNQVGERNHDLTSFLIFGLKGITTQCQRLFQEIRRHVSKELFINVMYRLFNRLQTPKKRVIAERQIEVLKLLLEKEEIGLGELITQTKNIYEPSLRTPRKALIRDLNHLIALGAITAEKQEDDTYVIRINLEWPTTITETAFFEAVKNLPEAKTNPFLQ